MSVAIPRVIGELERLSVQPPPPIHWPSALVGLGLAVTIVVSVAWAASANRVARGASFAAPPAASITSRDQATEPVAVATPTPIPPPTTTHDRPTAEQLRVANTRGLGVNLRAAAGERSARIKTLPEGTILESIGAEQSADGLVWKNVREPGGATGWVAAPYVAKQS